MPKSLWCELAIAARVSLAEAEKGQAKEEHRDALASVINTMMMLTRDHCTAESLDAVREARDAMFRADVRHKNGKTWALDGEGIQALRNVINAQDELTAELGRHDVTAAIMEAEMRLQAQVQGVEA